MLNIPNKGWWDVVEGKNKDFFTDFQKYMLRQKYDNLCQPDLNDIDHITTLTWNEYSKPNLE